MTPILWDFQNCVSLGIHDYVIPVVRCPISNCNAGTTSGRVVGFATMRIANTSDIVARGNDKGITFTQVCNDNASGSGSRGACLGSGNARLAYDR